jgi:hypothetical protein
LNSIGRCGPGQKFRQLSAHGLEGAAKRTDRLNENSTMLSHIVWVNLRYFHVIAVGGFQPPRKA